MNNAAVNIYAQVFIRTYVFIYLGYMYMSGIAGSDAKSVIKLLRNCQTVSPGSCTILYFYQQRMRVPISPHPCQHVAEADENFWLPAPPRKIPCPLSESWEEKACVPGFTCLGWSFCHFEQEVGREGMTHGSNATDSHCSYHVLLGFLA